MNDHQLLRYSRHILLDEIGTEGQQKLLDACVLVHLCHFHGRGMQFHCILRIKTLFQLTWLVAENITPAQPFIILRPTPTSLYPPTMSADAPTQFLPHCH